MPAGVTTPPINSTALINRPAPPSVQNNSPASIEAPVPASPGPGKTRSVSSIEHATRMQHEAQRRLQQACDLFALMSMRPIMTPRYHHSTDSHIGHLPHEDELSQCRWLDSLQALMQQQEAEPRKNAPGK